jgi:hypothetical protein
MARPITPTRVVWILEGARRLMASVALVAAGVLLPAAAAAQEMPSPERVQELMALSMELAEPGPEHARFADMVGSWDMAMTMWPQPGADPIEVAGTAESELRLGGRYLFTSTTIPTGFFAGESLSILGFDRRSEQYTLIGLDTVGTYWVTAQGPMGDDGRAVLSGEDFDPVFDGTQLYDFVLSWPDDDTFVSELIFKDEFHTGGGEPFRMLRIVSTRRQD